jgi:hypothetical protein
VNETSHATIHFGQVIGQLVGAGVESYHVDDRSGRATFLAIGSNFSHKIGPLHQTGVFIALVWCVFM